MDKRFVDSPSNADRVYQRISPHRLHEDIVRQVTEHIVSGQYAEGTTVPSEADLATMFGVSRTVVREATRVLVEKGLVTVRQGSGMWVAQMSHWNLLDQLVLATLLRVSPDARLVDDLYEARRTIEVEVAALAARHRQPVHVRLLGDTVAEMRSVGLGDRPLYGSLDLKFHHGLFVAAGNQVLQQMAWTTVQSIVRAQSASSLPEALRHEDSQRGHEAIYEAVRKGDEVRAREEVCKLLEIAQDTLSRSLLIKQAAAAVPVGI